MTLNENGHRPLHEIASEILGDWRDRTGRHAGKSAVNFAARPYLDAMLKLNRATDMYGQDSAHDIALYFLSNAQAYRGVTARRVKAELRTILGLK